MNAISNFTFHEKHNVRVQLLNGERGFVLLMYVMFIYS
jgi:hypothetical protein